MFSDPMQGTRRVLCLFSICVAGLALVLLPVRWLTATHAEHSVRARTGVVAPPAPPTNILLSSNTVADNSPAQTTVGTFSTTDPDSSTFPYSLISYTVSE